VCLAENTLPDGLLLASLNSADGGGYARVPVLQCRSLATYHRPSRVCVKPITGADRYVIASVIPAAGEQINLCLAHGPMQLYSPSRPARFARKLSRELRDVEETNGHCRTVFMGDVNIDPFHDGVVLPEGLNATPDLRVASRCTRTVDDVEYPFFYNPMWRLLGDDSGGPPGSFFWDSDETSIYWHMLDQALLRPQLLDHWAMADLTIPTRAGTIPLVTASGRPQRASASDHLPLVLSLRSCTNMEGETPDGP